MSIVWTSGGKAVDKISRRSGSGPFCRILPPRFADYGENFTFPPGRPKTAIAGDWVPVESIFVPVIGESIPSLHSLHAREAGKGSSGSDPWGTAMRLG